MEDFHSLLRKLGTNQMSPTAYDVAWVARLHKFAPDISNWALDWISENQLADGSWGVETPMYYHDRVVCTLAAMIALTYRGRRSKDKKQIERGLAALETITSGANEGLKADHSGATVGFELIVPIMLEEAERLDLIKHQQDNILSSLIELRDAKMARLSGMQINRFIAFAHSAEITGQDHLDLLDVENLQEKNGCVGNSPAATAHFALYVKPGDPAAINYLRTLVKEQGRVSTILPMEIFEIEWVLFNLMVTGLHKRDNEIRMLCEPYLKYLEDRWHPIDGLSCSDTFTPVDGDITSVAHQLLTEFGRPPSLDAIFSKEEEHHFRCYKVERDPSVDANIHILGALQKAGYPKDHPSVKKILHFIRSSRRREGHWSDKWNISPYYTTAHVIMQCKEYDPELCEEAAEWVLSQQQANGSWGSYGLQTAEETAYCIQALKIWQMYGGKVPKDKLEKAKLWLIRNCDVTPMPILWIGKSLYCPILVAKSAIISALMLSEM